MMRALYSGVAGLKNHQVRMDVIGNNISNVNTNGFKYERALFQDMISQSLQGAAAPKENIGGVNPKQVGLGMTIASIDKVMTQGALQTTGKGTDLAISGEGFFVLADGGKNYYTRSGNFDIDKQGNLVNPSNGMKVQGWNSNKNVDGTRTLNASSDAENIFIPLYSKEAANPTSFIAFKSNLDATTKPMPVNLSIQDKINQITNSNYENKQGHVTSINVFDDQGNQHKVRLVMWKDKENLWSASISMEEAEQLTVNTSNQVTPNVNLPSNTQLNLGFSPDGKLNFVSDGTNTQNQGNLSANLSFRLPGNPAIQNIALNFGEAGSIEGITQFASPFTTKAVEQDGKSMGYLESFQIDSSGSITGVFSNGEQEILAKVALANFTNPEGLTKKGSNNFELSNNSGIALISEANLQGLGEIHAGMLEMSNVDLAEQFTDMIVTQRGFQANSKAITTSDQMLQELLTLKR